jgi:hypothetical protein
MDGTASKQLIPDDLDLRVILSVMAIVDLGFDVQYSRL